VSHLSEIRRVQDLNGGCARWHTTPGWVSRGCYRTASASRNRVGV